MEEIKLSLFSEDMSLYYSDHKFPLFQLLPNLLHLPSYLTSGLFLFLYKTVKQTTMKKVSFGRYILSIFQELHTQFNNGYKIPIH